MQTSDFDYDLPELQIAQIPLQRGTARLLDLLGSTPEHRRVGELPDLLATGDLLVVNDTRVMPCRLAAHWQDTGGAVELLLVRREDDCRWQALTRPAKKARPGRILRIAPNLTAEVLSEGKDGLRTLLFSAPLEERLQQVGEIPLPPYIRRDLRPEDLEDYQTIFAREAGAVAAPTAGLHFTPEILARLESRGIALTEVTLHVGPGTFRPVKVEQIENHEMDAERFTVGPEAAEAIGRARSAGGRIVAVGTTVVRCLESVAGSDGSIAPGAGSTELFIRPGYRFRCVDLLMTNFHLPRSTLLMLVSAFGGKARMLAAYREAVKEDYRFYSYGDAMLVAPTP